MAEFSKMQENKYRKDTKYYCDFCKMFVQNNLLSKENHERSVKHQSRIKSHLRQTYRKQDRERIEQEKEAKIINEITNKAHQSMGIPLKGITHEKVSKPESSAKKYNINHYGYDNPNTDHANDIPIANQFKVTEEFLDKNQRTIGVGKIGEWEEVDDPEPEAPIIEEPEPEYPQQQIEPHASSNRKQLDDDDDEGLDLKESRGFQLKQKSVVIENDEDQAGEGGDEPIFKKRKFNGKSKFRKK